MISASTAASRTGRRNLVGGSRSGSGRWKALRRRPAWSRAALRSSETIMARIVVLGAGFAGLWAAIGAARKREEIGAAAEVLVVDRYPYHNIRVRNYEVDLSEAAIPLAELLDPIGVKHVVAEVIDVDV